MRLFAEYDGGNQMGPEAMRDTLLKAIFVALLFVGVTLKAFGHEFAANVVMIGGMISWTITVWFVKLSKAPDR